MSSKVVEADAKVHSLAMAVAVRVYLSRTSSSLIRHLACHQLAIVR